MMHSSAADAFPSPRPLTSPSFTQVLKHEAPHLAAMFVERKREREDIQSYSDVAALLREQAAIPASRSGVSSPSFTDPTESTSSEVSEFDPAVEGATEAVLSPGRDTRLQFSSQRLMPIGTPPQLSTLSPRAVPYTPIIKDTASRSLKDLMDFSFVDDIDTPHPSPYTQQLQLGRTQAFSSPPIVPPIYTTTHAASPRTPSSRGSLLRSPASSTFVTAPSSPMPLVGLGFSSPDVSDPRHHYRLPPAPRPVPPRPWYHPLWSHPMWEVHPVEVASWQTQDVSRLPFVYAPQPVPVPVPIHPYSGSAYVHVAQPGVASPLGDAQVFYTTPGAAPGMVYPGSSPRQGPSLEYLPSGYVQSVRGREHGITLGGPSSSRRPSYLARIEESREH
ncbi:hypothetical protein C8Q80DRAFT_245186 [Daedaleopsis nitida]|nr:hypothetical protein C8Q80DRAFT_245186 [Daedaleopsis nitida]